MVDDDKSFRRATARLLREAGYEAREYASVADFLKAAPFIREPGCVLSDLRMPDESGLDLQRHLNESGGDLALVFVTAYMDAVVSERAEADGAVSVLHKPVRKKQLVEAIERALATRQRQP